MMNYECELKTKISIILNQTISYLKYFINYANFFILLLSEVINATK